MSQNPSKNDFQKRSIDLWSEKASEWDAWTGKDGDANRRFNSDPVLWRMLGDVQNLYVLDAGCGTGYLSIALARRGAKVIAVDQSEQMISITRKRAAEAGVELTTYINSTCLLSDVQPESVDKVVSNYVLMDLADLDTACREQFRVLKRNGKAVFIFSHPCFCPPQIPDTSEDGSARFTWKQSYFEEVAVEQEWGKFSTPFISYHRPLRNYWKAFLEAGFSVLDFDEPVLDMSLESQLEPSRFQRFRRFPYSVAFLLNKA